MALARRTINVSLAQQVQAKTTIRFFPVLTGADGDVLLEKEYAFDTDASGDATIALPVKSSGNIKYKFAFPQRDGNITEGVFFLTAGSAIGLDELIAGGGPATPTSIDYIDQKFASSAVRYDTGQTLSPTQQATARSNIGVAAGGLIQTVVGEVPSGAINGINATFTTANQFIPETVNVTVNGIRLKKVDEFNNSGTTTIILAVAPGAGETVLVDYIKS